MKRALRLGQAEHRAGIVVLFRQVPRDGPGAVESRAAVDEDERGERCPGLDAWGSTGEQGVRGRDVRVAGAQPAQLLLGKFVAVLLEKQQRAGEGGVGRQGKDLNGLTDPGAP